MWLVYIWSKADGSLIYDSEPLNPNTAVFKLGSADQRGSATGSHGVRERIPKSSNCLQFLTIYDPYVFKFAHISQSVTQSQCIAWKCCRGLARQAFC